MSPVCIILFHSHYRFGYYDISNFTNLFTNQIVNCKILFVFSVKESAKIKKMD